MSGENINVNNIEIGAGDCELQFTGEGAPVDVGACDNAVLNVDQKYLDVEAGQTLDAIESFLIGRDVKFKIDFKEDSFRNLVIACGGDPADIDDSDPGVDVYELPGLSATTTPFIKVVYTVPQVRNKDKNFIYTLHKCKKIGNLVYSWKKDKERMYTVEFKAYADKDNDNSPLKFEREK